jgi:hypothetical protein
MEVYLHSPIYLNDMVLNYAHRQLHTSLSHTKILPEYFSPTLTSEF